MDTRNQIIHQLIRTDKQPFKPLLIRNRVGISSQLMSHYLKRYVDMGILIKEGSRYRVLDMAALADELGDTDSHKLAWPKNENLEDFEQIVKEAIAARVLGDDAPTIAVKDELKQLITDTEQAIRFLTRKSMTQEKAEKILSQEEPVEKKQEVKQETVHKSNGYTENKVYPPCDDPVVHYLGFEGGPLGYKVICKNCKVLMVNMNKPWIHFELEEERYLNGMKRYHEKLLAQEKSSEVVET